MATGKTVWGIDVASSAIKGVRMRLDGDRVQILEADIVPFQGDPSPADSPGRDRRIWQALQRFEIRHRVSRARVAVGLPGAIFFVRPFSIFQVGTRTEAELARYEMEQHIPFGMDAVLWDYDIFDAVNLMTREKEGVLYAMKKEVLSNYLLSLSAAHIEPAQVQAAPLALYNFVKHELRPDRPTLVADVGAAQTTLLAIVGDRYWLRTVNAGGESISAALRNAFKPREVGREEAETIKVNLPRLARRGEAAELITPALRSLVGELRNAVTHLAQEHKQTMDRLILLGAAGATYGLASLIDSELKMRVVVPAGLGHIEIADTADAAYINENLPSLATAIGMGLQALGRPATRVNMVDATLTERRSQTMLRRSAAIAVAAGLLLTISFGLFTSWRRATLQRGRDALRQQLNPVSVRLHNSKRLVAAGQAEASMDRLEQAAAGRTVWLSVMNKISRMLPDNEKSSVPADQKLWLVRLSLREKPNAPGVYEGEIDAGTLLRRDGSHLAYVQRQLRVPLEKDDSGLFRNVSEIEASRSSPTLSFSGGSGANRFFLVRLRFEAVVAKGGKP